jgi:Transposase domain (DUF772)/Transposase DDE domain
MIAKQETLNLSPYMAIYDYVVPKDHFLRQIKDLVDFSFVLDELKENYCLDNGRNAIPPIRMFKYLILKAIYDVSDVDLVERSRSDMALKYFLDMAPEEDVINPSSLTKFRKLRLKHLNLLNLLIEKTVKIALEKGIIKSKTIIVDATHSASRFNQRSPQEYLKEKSKNVRKAVYQIDETLKEKFPKKVTSNDVTAEINYCQELIDAIEQEPTIAERPSVKERLNVLMEIVEDCQEQLTFSNDPDARKGHKSADDSFFGYKTHLAMSDERIITAAVISSGEQGDGQYLQELVETTRDYGMKIDTVIGDTAYSEKENLVYAKNNEFELVSKLHPIVVNGGRKPENNFFYNKDAGMFVCPAGHLAVKKHIQNHNTEKRNKSVRYQFDVEKCKVCPLRYGCYKEGAKTKSYTYRIKSNAHQEQEAFQETERFKTLASKRYKIEAKNSELKNRHGYKMANSTGLFSMSIQGATTIFTANLKRIIKLMDEKEEE